MNIDKKIHHLVTKLKNYNSAEILSIFKTTIMK